MDVSHSLHLYFSFELCHFSPPKVFYEPTRKKEEKEGVDDISREVLM